MTIVSIAEVQEKFPHWPYKPDGTYRLIALGQLGCVRVGRRVFVTSELLEAFIAKHTVAAKVA